jgi:hypothetical protein
VGLLDCGMAYVSAALSIMRESNALVSMVVSVLLLFTWYADVGSRRSGKL